MPDYGSYVAPAAGISSTRTGRLFSQVQLILGTIDDAALRRIFNKLPNQLIYSKLDEGQIRLATDLLCLEKSATLTVTAGVATTPTGFYRAKLIKLPTGLWYPLEEVSLTEYDTLERATASASLQTPIYFKRWSTSITFFPSPGSTTYTMYYWGVPTTEIAQAVEPEVPAYMDNAILYWAVKELSPIAGRADLFLPYSSMWEEENRKLMNRWRGTRTVSLQASPDVYA